MPLSSENIKLLKDIIEGRQEIFWHKWWEEKSAEFEQELGRTDYLKIKYGHLQGASEYLDKMDIAYTWSQKGRQIDYYSNFDKSLFDEEGKLKKEVLDKFWKGAIGLFNQGNYEQSMKIFNKMLSKALKSKNPQDFDELEFDLEGLIKLGESNFALACLKIIASLDTDDDLKFQAIQNAKTFIDEFNYNDNYSK